jgi:hypothetical protein
MPLYMYCFNRGLGRAIGSCAWRLKTDEPEFVPTVPICDFICRDAARISES